MRWRREPRSDPDLAVPLLRPSNDTRTSCAAARTALRHAGVALALACGLLPFRDAAAAVVCADTVAEIATAIEGLESGDGVDVKIVQGTYSFGASLAPFFYGGSVMLRGGYLPGCNSRSVDPTNTVLDFTAAGPGAEFSLVGPQAVTITWLTIQDAGKLAINVNNDAFEGPAIDIHNTIIRRIGNAPGDTLPPVTITSTLGELDFRDNLVHDIVSTQSGCGVWFGHDGNVSTLVNNTFGDLSTAASGQANWCFRRQVAGYDPGIVTLTNNIFWSQPVQGAVSVENGFLVQRVHSTMPSYSGPAGTSIGTLTTNPLFVDAPGNNFRLQNTSTSLNSGTTYAPGGLPDVDLQNDPRIVGSAPDRGAYESSFDDTTTMLVTSSNDSGAGSLRQAIIGANATATPKQIRFQIPGACPSVIVLQSALPDITVPLQILGHTQPGSAPNQAQGGFDATLCVVLHGAGSLNGLRVPSAANAASLRVSGVAFSNFPASALVLDGGHDHVVTGSQFGGSMPGSALFSSGTNITVGQAVSGFSIGGDALSSRNLIGAANGGAFGGYGIWVGLGASGGQIINNLVGVDRTLTAATPNRVGIRMDGSSSVIRRNAVGGNTHDGLQLNGSDNVVQNNSFGFRTATHVFGNGDTGVALNGGAAQNSIGSLSVTGNPVAEGNRIAHNAFAGIHLRGFAAGSNLLRGNRSYDNGAANGGLNVDLGAFGPTTNDAGDGDSGPNGLVNHPLVTVVTHADVPPDSINVAGLVGGTLQTAAGTYIVDVYGGDACSNGRGDALNHLGQLMVTVPAGGSTSYSLPVTLPRLQDYFISATATSSTASTSEIGPCYELSQEEDLPLLVDGFEG
jgi:hypothetical protein